VSVASERTTATALLARHAAGLRFEMLAPETVAHAKAAVLDLIGIAVRAGSEGDSTPALTGAVDALDGGGPARVIGSDRGYQPQHAALLNATYAHTLDFDDTHVGGSIHPGAPTIPAALAVAETEHRSGRALLAAIVAGYDVCVRLSEALTPAAQYARGFHPSATCGGFGAAAAVANLVGDDAATVANAFGVALSSAAGSMQYLENGSWNKRFHVGFAAYNGIVAERFARAGVVGAADALHGRFGFRHAYAGAGSFDGLEAALAGARAIDETAFKPYPSCRYTHAALDELIDLRRTHGIDPATIEQVTIALPRVSFALVKDPELQKRAPQSIVDGQFSMVWVAAVALLRGGFGWDDYALLADPTVLELIGRIEVVADERIEALGQSMGASVRVRANGTTYERFTPAPKGEPDRPLAWDDVVAKFDGLAAVRYDAGRRRRIVAAVRDLETLADVADLTALLGT
jgi:2-methylcitrate dehydratase PrpD